GLDRPGIVADLAELIYECDCNLEDSSMTILGSEFAVLLLLSGQGPDVERRLSAGCKRLEWEKRLTVFFRPLEGDPLARAPGRHDRRATPVRALRGRRLSARLATPRATGLGRRHAPLHGKPDGPLPPDAAHPRLRGEARRAGERGPAGGLPPPLRGTGGGRG